jgi:hypothetical protein
VQHQAGLARRRLVFHQHAFGPLDQIVAIDKEDALTVFDTGLDKRYRRHAGDDHGGVGAIVQGLAQRRRDIVGLASGVQHHHDLADCLQLARDGLHDIRLEG